MNEFSDIIGNEQIIKTLKNSARNGEVFHAYIFNGPAGSGKKTLADSFAKFIFCKTKEPGCKCHSCVQFDSGNHSDLTYVRRNKEKSLGVELVRRELIDELSKKPFEYEKRVFIIEDAELMTIGAQNALLRSIEEPPAHNIIILLAGSLSFLPTVLSRCFIYKMQAFDSGFIFKRLKDLGYDDNKSQIVSEYAESIGGALSLYENDGFFEMRKSINDSLAILSMGAKNGTGLTSFFENSARLEAYKEQAADFTALTLMWFRDVLAYKATGNEALVRQRDELPRIVEFAGVFPFASLYKKIGGVLEFSKGLAANASFAAALDALAIRLDD